MRGLRRAATAACNREGAGTAASLLGAGVDVAPNKNDGDKSYRRKNANRSQFDLRLNGSCQSRFVRRGRTGPASDDSEGKAPAALTLFDESAGATDLDVLPFRKGNQIRSQLLSQKSKRFVTLFKAGVDHFLSSPIYLQPFAKGSSHWRFTF